jgi:cyanophycinase
MRRQGIHRITLILTSFLALVMVAAAEEKSTRPPRLNPAGIDGALLICGDKVPDTVRDRFAQLAGGDKAKLVLVSADKDTPKEREDWQARKPASVVVVSLSSREAANDTEILKPLRQATGVWLQGGIYPGTTLEKELQAVLARGGIVGGTTALTGTVLIGEEKRLQRGFDLLPGAMIAPHTGEKRWQPFAHVLEKQPHLVGLDIGEEAALLIKGRQMRVLGKGWVRVELATVAMREERTVELKSGEVSDYTMWRRAAWARSGPAFPPMDPAVPEVSHGSLVIVGGGAMPAAVVRKFIELAGGPDAQIVVLPTAQGGPVPRQFGEANMFEKAGAKNVLELPATQRKDVEDPKNLEILKKAKGIWFGGGRQWRFVDAYEGTKAETLFHEVLRRGGVIGGSSAGASIQAEYMVRGSPLGNTEMMCEGYERGLGFLPGVAVDQHFTQRKRFADMSALVKKYPQLLGIGIDESTALIVHGHEGEVMGRGKVHFYDRRKPVVRDGPDYEAVGSDGRYDLKQRKVLATQKEK